MVTAKNGLARIAVAATLGGLVSAPALAAGDAMLAATAPAAKTAVVVVDGVPGSDALLGGDYAGGLAQSEAAYGRAPRRNVVPLAVNLCAAHTVLGNLQRAEAECARALRASAQGFLGSLSDQQYRAIVLVNRGVLRQLAGDASGAGSDFSEAAGLFPELAVARSNLVLLGASGAPAATTTP